MCGPLIIQLTRKLPFRSTFVEACRDGLGGREWRTAFGRVICTAHCEALLGQGGLRLCIQWKEREHESFGPSSCLCDLVELIGPS